MLIASFGLEVAAALVFSDEDILQFKYVYGELGYETFRVVGIEEGAHKGVGLVVVEDEFE